MPMPRYETEHGQTHKRERNRPNIGLAVRFQARPTTVKEEYDVICKVQHRLYLAESDSRAIL
eukprot:1137170-Pelagomonas_calceolata.AAC.11